MLAPHALCQQRVLLVLVITILATGCQTGADRVPTPAPTLPPEAGDTRSSTPLAMIEPTVDRPSCETEPPPLSERSVTQIERAQTLIAEQRYTEAAIQLERALRYDPNHPRIQRTLAVLHWEAGNIERARIHAQRALESCADDAVAHYVIGRCLGLDGNPAAAMTAYRTALASSDFGDNVETAVLCHYHLADVLAGEGYLEAALDQYAQFEQRAAALPEAPRAGELATLLRGGHGAAAAAKADLLDQLGRYSQAADALAPVVARSSNGELLLRYGELLAKAGRFTDALEASKQISSNDRPVLALLDRIHAGLGNSGRLIDELRERLNKAPGDATLSLYLAEKLAASGDVEAAIDLLHAQLEAQPQMRELRLGMIDLLLQNRAWDRALHACGEAIVAMPERGEEIERRVHSMATDSSVVASLLDEQPDDVPAASAYLRGILASAAKRPEDAKIWLERACNRDEDFVPARAALARWYLSANRHADALGVAQRRDPDTAEDASLERVLGDIYERLDQAANAERHYRAAIQLRRNDTGAMLALADLYRDTGEPARAQRQLRVLLDHEPKHDGARERLTILHLTEGNLELALREFEELLQRSDDPHVTARCEAFIEQIRKPDAEAFRARLLAAIEEHGSDALTWLRIADSYAPDDEAGEQHEAYRQALLADPDSEEAVIGFVLSATRLLRFEEAAEQMAAALERRPNRDRWRLGYTERRIRPPIRYFGLIELYWIVHDFDAALRVAEAAEDRTDLDESTRARYRLLIIESLHLAERDADALARINSWIAVDPDNRGLTLMLADELLRQSKLDEAIEVLQLAHQDDTSNRAVLATLIGALIDAGQIDRAMELTLDLLATDPDSDAFVAQMVLVLGQAERFSDAMELVRNRLLRTFDRQRFQDMTVALLAEADRHEDAAEYVESLLDASADAIRALHEGQVEPAQAQVGPGAVTRYPNEPYTMEALHERVFQLRMNLSGTLLTGRDFEGALDLLSEWLQGATSPGERLEYLRRLSFCHQGLGNDEAAHDALLEALEIQPSNVTFNNDIAYAWIDRGERLDEAEPMIRYAVSRSPRQSAYLDTYGWLLYKRGSFAEAKRWLTRANHGRGGADPVIRDHLGDAYWQLGERDAAIEQWKAAVQAIEARDANVTPSTDERRVQVQAPRKIEAAEKGETPPVAPTAPSVAGEEDDTGDDED